MCLLFMYFLIYFHLFLPLLLVPMSTSRASSGQTTGGIYLLFFFVIGVMDLVVVECLCVHVS